MEVWAHWARQLRLGTEMGQKDKGEGEMGMNGKGETMSKKDE